MRVTNTMMTNQALNDLERLRQRYSKAQSAVNGRVLERPSEDPQRVVEMMDLSGAKLRLERAKRSSEDAKDWLMMNENSMTNIIDRLQAAAELAVAAGGPGGIDPDARESFAAAMDGIRQSLFREMNAQFRDQYIFGGKNASDQPFADVPGAGVQPTGDISGKLNRDVAPNLAVQVNVAGTDLLAAGDFMKTLSDMAANLRAGQVDQVTGDRLGEIRKALSHMVVVRSDLGVRANQVEQYERFADDALFTIEERMGRISGADLETAVIKMTEAQNSYQAALAAFAKSLPTSLLDYMLR